MSSFLLLRARVAQNCCCDRLLTMAIPGLQDDPFYLPHIRGGLGMGGLDCTCLSCSIRVAPCEVTWVATWDAVVTDVQLQALLHLIPEDRLLIETDAPYLVPRTIK